MVYLPPGYEENTGQRYPVMYLQDGQNLFDDATAFGGAEWHVDETVEALIGSGTLAPMIVVGIYNAGEHRIDEYTPAVDKSIQRGGKAKLYGKMLVEELKPFIDTQYRTKPEPASTGLGGSSLGGLVTLYLGIRYPHVFGKLAVISPSIWWAKRSILRFVDRLKYKNAQRIWLDVGTDEGGPSTVENTRIVRDRLIQLGWEIGHDLCYHEAEGACHDENAWSCRVEPMLKFLFAAPANHQVIW